MPWAKHGTRDLSPGEPSFYSWHNLNYGLKTALGSSCFLPSEWQNIGAGNCMGTSTKTSSVCGGFLEMNLFDDLQFAIGPHTACFSVHHIDSTMKTSLSFIKEEKQIINILQ